MPSRKGFAQNLYKQYDSICKFSLFYAEQHLRFPTKNLYFAVNFTGGGGTPPLQNHPKFTSSNYNLPLAFRVRNEIAECVQTMAHLDETSHVSNYNLSVTLWLRNENLKDFNVYEVNR